MSRHVTRMTIWDAEHYTEQEKEDIVAGYPAHERDARSKGIPVLGSGRIFPISQEEIECEPFPTPDYYRIINGLDIGWDHPTAAIQLAYDPEPDIVYVTKAYKKREATPLIHSGALKPWGCYPWSWPHDGLQHDKGSGEELAGQYRNHGLNMLPQRSQFEDGSNGVEAGLMLMLDRMQTGRLKVFKHLNEWFSEFLLYHRKEGKVVKEYDDLMSSTRYAIMDLRYALSRLELEAETDYDDYHPEDEDRSEVGGY